MVSDFAVMIFTTDDAGPGNVGDHEFLTYTTRSQPVVEVFQ